MWIDPMIIEHNRINVLSDRLTQPPSFYVNCGGHAFGIDGWYTPSKFVDAWNEYHVKGKNHWRNLERKYVKNILHDFPELRLARDEEIRNVDIDIEVFEIIAFRIQRVPFYCNFHFMRCESDGTWTEKKGTHNTIYHYLYEDIYDVWGKYDGKLYFFVRQRQG